MWGRLRALIVKELLAVWRDPKGRAVLIVPPLMQLVIFSYAATLEVKNVDIGIFNQDTGRWGVELAQRIEGAPTFRKVVPLYAVADIHRAVDAQRVLVALHIGQDFSRAVEAGRPATVQVILDGRRSNAAQIVAGYLGGIVNGLGAEIAGRSGRVSLADAIVARNWFNPNLEYVWFTVPNLIGVIGMLIGLIVTALSVARERELGTFDQLLVSPLRTPEILLGKTVPPLLIGLVHGTVYILAAVFVFGVPLRGSLALLYLALMVYLAALIGVGLFISSLSQTQQQAILGAFLFTAPAVMLSGFATPVENMPEWLQTATLVNPLRHFLVIVKGVFLKALPVNEALPEIAWLALIAVVTLSAAAWLFRRRME